MSGTFWGLFRPAADLYASGVFIRRPTKSAVDETPDNRTNRVWRIGRVEYTSLAEIKSVLICGICGKKNKNYTVSILCQSVSKNFIRRLQIGDNSANFIPSPLSAIFKFNHLRATFLIEFRLKHAGGMFQKSNIRDIV